MFVLDDDENSIFSIQFLFPRSIQVSPAMEPEIIPPKKPIFDPLKAHEITEGKQAEFRKVPVPSHRLKPLKDAWDIIYDKVYNVMNVDIRMNLKARRVELKNKRETPDIGHLQRCADFVHAFVLGFDVPDAKLMLSYDELYIDSFEIRDVKRLSGEHLSRAVGRLSGKSGKTKFAIENATKTRIVIADKRIHVMGPFARIKIARSCLCSLIMELLDLHCGCRRKKLRVSNHTLIKSCAYPSGMQVVSPPLSLSPACIPDG
ncbi:pre-rRNA-processing protein PNO1 [Striga asiatica]|uniref:Pre-rRNA-processing protein PNO1 n=1 Tax=Striga asiatica TaxID=4170 RepID=A0A5A7Q9K2_STRAF|nr:pre-rRNA-processing protein PNO1 [Striga asiatica]